ncbi:hypothetical protein ZOSMA_122G00840 [Zostera marina]|uniref:Charged multivesicular body protein 2b n=1 Tax=Zostera marina TaxID=29655 RepID=A0A0K9Q0J7_ZOSMR|nr:hypothetical protein ZOSMA_122G00840 [Zostera marina]
MSKLNPFTKKPTAQEMIRESKRGLVRSSRSVDRDIGGLQAEEKKLIAEIKRTSKNGNKVATKNLALQLVKLRQQIAKLQKTRGQIVGMTTHTQTMSTSSSVVSAMEGANKVTTAMNEAMAPEKQKKILMEFQRQSAQMNIKSENISDTIDDVLDDDDIQNETDNLTNQILGEIGIDTAAQLVSTPTNKISRKNSAFAESSDLDIERLLAGFRNQ